MSVSITRRRNIDPARPPKVGPYAVAEWDAAEGCWKRRLTAEGTALVEAALADSPAPGKLLATAWPSLWQACRAAGFGPPDVDGWCREAAVRAAVLFDPANAAGAGFTTYWAQWCRGVVSRALHDWLRARRAGVKVVSGHAPLRAGGGDGACALDFAPAADDPAADPARRERCERLRRAVLAALRRRVPSRRLRELFALRHGLHDGRPLTLEETGEVFGVTRERVRQLEAKVLAKILPDLRAVHTGELA